MPIQERQSVYIADIQSVSPQVKKFTLHSVDDKSLHEFSAGSHAYLQLNLDEKVINNPYSIISIASDGLSYEIAVKLDVNGKGGSNYLHNNVSVGDRLSISYPYNNFSIYKPAKKHILIAGGIGITPFISYLRDFAFLPSTYELHYLVNEASELIFLDLLKEQLQSDLHIYVKKENDCFDSKKLIASCKGEEHVYICGPESLVQDVRKHIEGSALQEDKLHFEIFKPSQQNNKFQAQLSQSNKVVDVDVDETLLEALERNGIETNYYCRSGACGECKTKVLAGEVEHRDFYLSQLERDNNTHIMPCVSRAKSETIKLNI